MNHSALDHGTSCFYKQPVARDAIRFGLFAADGDLAACSILYFPRSAPAQRRAARLQARPGDGLRQLWQADVAFDGPAHYVKYFFKLTDSAGAVAYLSGCGVTAQPPEGGFYELLQAHESDLPSVPAWAQGCVYYQIFPERFARGEGAGTTRPLDAWDAPPTRDNFLGGNLSGITEKIPFLKDLGAECLYLTPVFAADFNHKYATTDYFRVDPDFGTSQDLCALVNAAHRAGIRVLLDGVFNHVGVHFPPFEDLLAKGAASAYRDWFYPRQYPLRISADCYECVGDYPYMPRLRLSNPKVQAYVLDVLLYWLRTAHIDGWRFDVADELDPAAVRFFRRGVRRDFPQALMLAETWGDASRLVNEGDQFDCAMHYPLRDAVLDFFVYERIDAAAFDRRLQRLLMRHPAWTQHAMYTLLGSHDTPRLMTLCGGDEAKARLAYAFLMLFAGSPAIYYGDEAGMTGENDPGCRAGMRWQNLPHPMAEWLRRLTTLRKEHPALRTGSCRTLLADADRRLYVLERADDTERVAAVFNASDAPQTWVPADAGGTVDIPPKAVHIVITKGRRNHAEPTEIAHHCPGSRPVPAAAAHRG